MKNVQFSQTKAKALQKVNRMYFKGKSEEICSYLARDALDAQVYSIAQTFSLQSSDSSIAIELLDKWSATGHPEEKPWFVVRYILFKLASEYVADARLIMNHYSATDCFSQAKAFQKIVEFLLEAISLKSVEMFQAIQGKFQPYVQKDPELGEMMDRIGQIYFGIIKHRQPTMLDMMSRMLGM